MVLNASTGFSTTVLELARLVCNITGLDLEPLSTTSRRAPGRLRRRAAGELSSLLAPSCEEYQIVEGSQANIEATRRRVPSAILVHALWEEYEPKRRFSDIIAFNALEHVSDPVGLLKRLRPWLEPGGRLHVIVPNGLSLHRLVGVELGLLPHPLHLTDDDRAQGHECNYTIESLRTDLAAGGFPIVHWQGIFLKVLSNRQMLDWEWELIRALDRVGQRFPSHGSQLYAVAEP